MTLQTLANLAEIFGALMVVIGVIFGLLEFRHFRQQRQECRVARGKADDGHARRKLGNETLHMWQHELPVIVRPQATGPRIE